MDRNLKLTDALRDADFKDDSPLKTVERIKAILASHGIETEERWMESSVPYCYSIRVSIAGTTFGVNGKGVTKEFALASGYGELMERLQLGYVGADETQKDGSYSLNDSQSVRVSARELLERNRDWYEAFSRGLHWYTGEELSPDAILLQYADKDGNVNATPYYCVTRGTKEYLPVELRKGVYTANGCAAGNTMEEAIVQAISETVERHHQLKIIADNLTPADVPEEVLKTCKIAYSIISFLRDNGFRVVIKDCSLGTKYPVICACIIDLRTGRYHTHFGAYPVFEIALQRALTESFQGRNVDNIARFEGFCYKTEDVFGLENLSSELVKGVAEKMPGFFVGTPQYPFDKNIGFAGKNNRELLWECVDFIREQGYDILVRDCSCLGFPTYQVLIPGYSEVFCHRLSPKYNDQRYTAFAKNALRNPSVAKMNDLLGFMLHIAQVARVPKNIGNVHSFRVGANLPLKISQMEDAYLMAASLAYISYSLNRYSETIKHIDRMICSGAKNSLEYLVCVKRYLSLRLNHYDEAGAKQVLAFFHGAETIGKLYSCLEEKRNPLEEFTLHCDKTCTDRCCLYEHCCQRRVDELTKLIVTKTAELDFKTLERSFSGK